ncbi:MAG TPA: fibronectin type III-like domain-contianing protein, partial [Solirubrobacteraceae bacterium]
QSYPGVADSEVYKEGVFVGYRWFDAHNLEPAFPFGFGLSYTSFSYDALAATRTAGGARITATITNTGSRRGSSLAQLYVGLPSVPGAPQPPSQLKGFTKLTLAPGRSRRVSFPLNGRSLAYWNTGAGAWSVAPGCDTVMVGPSSREALLKGTLAVDGASCPGALARVKVTPTP